MLARGVVWRSALSDLVAGPADLHWEDPGLPQSNQAPEFSELDAVACLPMLTVEPDSGFVLAVLASSFEKPKVGADLVVASVADLGSKAKLIPNGLFGSVTVEAGSGFAVLRSEADLVVLSVKGLAVDPNPARRFIGGAC